MEPHCAGNSKFPIFTKLKFWVPGLHASQHGIQNVRGAAGLRPAIPPPLEMNRPRPGAGQNRLANSKRVTVASKIVSRDDSFCNSIVSGQMKNSAKTFRISDKPISPVSGREDALKKLTSPASVCFERHFLRGIPCAAPRRRSRRGAAQ